MPKPLAGFMRAKLALPMAPPLDMELGSVFLLGACWLPEVA